MPNKGTEETLAGFVVDLLALGVASASQTVNGTGTVYLRSFPLPRNVSFGWEVRFSSVGSINVKVELEQGNFRPGTEDLADAAWAVPDNKAATPMFAAITDAVIHSAAYSPNASGFGRLKLTGISGNNAATKIDVARMYTVKNSF